MLQSFKGMEVTVFYLLEKSNLVKSFYSNLLKRFKKIACSLQFALEASGSILIVNVGKCFESFCFGGARLQFFR